MKKSIIIPSVIILAGAAVIAGLELSNTTHIFHSKPSANTIVTVGRQLPTGSSNHSSTGRNTPKSNGAGTNNPDGFATNTSGKTSAPGDSSQWITSSTGVITVKQPAANALLSSGAMLSGSTTSAGPIHYVLLDNETGQIAQGILNVTYGNFSGQINFSAHSTNGQMNVFTATPDGREQNVIQIGVNFSQ